MKVLFYADYDVFGGHEVMAVHFANALAAHAHVYFAHRSSALGGKLNPDIIQLRAPTKTRRPFPYFQSWMRRGKKECQRMIDTVRPDWIIAVQGMIELCVDILQAKRPPETKIISYIPVTQAMRTTGAYLGCLRDGINRKIYASFDAFITISQGQAENIKNLHNVSRPIFVLPNVYENKDCQAIKIKRKEKYKILTVGRLDIKQKGLYLIPEIIRNLREKSIAFEWRILGSGPGRKTLLQLAQKHRELSIMEWTHDVRSQYEWADVVASLSLSEGVSLVMLESIANGRPFIGSNITCFKEYLPPPAIIKDARDFPRCLLAVFENENESAQAYSLIQKRISTENSPEKFNDNIGDLAQWLKAQANAVA